MSARRLAAALAVVFPIAPAAGAAERGLGFGAPPDWVEHVAVDGRASPPATEISGGIDYLLADQQLRVGPRGEERFVPFAKRIVNEAGLESASQLSVSFDPSYESVELHYLRLRRGGAVLDRLARGRVELVQRESELEAQIYDGALQAHTFVEDLRVGDVVEYAYTLRGANPVMQGRLSDSFSVEWSVPLRHQRYRLLWPRERTLLVRNHGTSIAPEVTEHGPWREYVWEATELAAVGDQGQVPPWVVEWAWVQLSEFQSWAEVVAWARPLYAAPASLPPDLAALVEGWKKLPDEAARAGAALRFVQDEVRYVGIEMGAGSHRPNPPELVASRRFGDCKDKSLLLTTLLGALGVRARPALVSTDRRSALDDWLPTPYAFNHVVTRAELDGRVFWLDPTRSAQGGPIADVCFPGYERALVVDEGILGLSEIPPQLPKAPTYAVQEELRVRDDSQPVEYSVETRHEGCSADRVRYDLLRRSREQVAQGYLDYYAGAWPGIQSKSPLEVQDDREKNVVVITERYSIPAFWGEDAEPGRRQRSLWAGTLSGELDKPEVFESAPLAVSHPVWLRHTSRVRLPGDWGLEPDELELATQAARFSFHAQPKGEAVTLEYEYQSLDKVVPAPRVSQHLAALDKMRGRLAYKLTRPSGARLSGTNWVAVMTLLMAVALAGLGGVTLVRLVPREAAARERLSKGAAVLGALLLFAAALHGAAIVRAFKLCRPAAWAQRTLPDGTQHHALWAPFLLAQLVVLVLLLAGALALFARLARDRRASRGAWVFWAFGQTGLLFAAAAALAALPGGRGSGLEASLRDALLSLVPLVPGTALALAGGGRRPGALDFVSSTRRPRAS